MYLTLAIWVSDIFVEPRLQWGAPLVTAGGLGYCSLPCYRAHAAGQCPARPEAEKPAKKPRNEEPRENWSLKRKTF